MEDHGELSQPLALYQQALPVVATNSHDLLVVALRLPAVIGCDLCQTLLSLHCLPELETLLSNLNLVLRLLTVHSQRRVLYDTCQVVRLARTNVAVEWTKELAQWLTTCQDKLSWSEKAVVGDRSSRVQLVQAAVNIASFLLDIGWFDQSAAVYKIAVNAVGSASCATSLNWRLSILTGLMVAQVKYCLYNDAQTTFSQAQVVLESLEERGQLCSTKKALLWIERCQLEITMSQYDEAEHWSQLALSKLNQKMPVAVLMRVLHISCKACVVKRKFRKAGCLIKWALKLAVQHFDHYHPRVADVMLDYGFFLLGVDSIEAAADAYSAALTSRSHCLGPNNLLTALAHEDLSYTLYVREYNSGDFIPALAHANLAIDVLERLLPPSHLLLASTNRIKALILEEIAIDHAEDGHTDLPGLKLAEQLHLRSMELVKRAFGERNVQTAKHYGNLGRLYQTLHRFEEAALYHQKAIEIKELIVGKEDYEVALSVGHLASLYNYDMEKYDEAEQLYLRSIAIGRRLYGSCYSGLEYDYRGLVHLYSRTNQPEKRGEYVELLHSWQAERDQREETGVYPPGFASPDDLSLQVSAMDLKNFLTSFLPTLHLLDSSEGLSEDCLRQ